MILSLLLLMNTADAGTPLSFGKSKITFWGSPGLTPPFDRLVACIEGDASTEYPTFTLLAGAEEAYNLYVFKEILEGEETNLFCYDGILTGLDESYFDQHVEMGDFNDDGKADLAVVSAEDDAVYIYSDVRGVEGVYSYSDHTNEITGVKTSAAMTSDETESGTDLYVQASSSTAYRFTSIEEDSIDASDLDAVEFGW
ncbi:MAG: hypothetical protein AAFV53_41550 [Myxococcota bacterium]